MQFITEQFVVNPGHSHDCPQVDATGLGKASSLAQEEGIDLAKRCDDLSWTGGRVVLVATDKPTSEWKPIAQRIL